MQVRAPGAVHTGAGGAGSTASSDWKLVASIPFSGQFLEGPRLDIILSLHPGPIVPQTPPPPVGKLPSSAAEAFPSLQALQSHRPQEEVNALF